MSQVVKPFVKWAGGKYKLAEIIIEETNKVINFNEEETYIDPFVGGGGMFFAMMNKFSFKRKIISDINPELINTYKKIKTDLSELVIELEKIENDFNMLSTNDEKKAYYLVLREIYNEGILSEALDTKQAALFIGLNKLGFNGLYRVNGKGLFNVPFGQKKIAKLFDHSNLVAANEILQETEIYCMDYKKCIDFISEKSIVYFDSPYRPLPGALSFTSYAKSEFNDQNQIELCETSKQVIKLGGKFYLSNSDPVQVDETDLFFDELYKDFSIKRIEARRMIGATAARRGKISEILVIGK